jgi:two-component system sensor histidine kinase KdpD
MSALFVQRASDLSTIAHEMRTPLSALQTTSELLDRDFEELEQQQMRSMVSSIHRGVVWLRGLMENLLTAASVQDGRFEIHRRPIDLRDVVAEVRHLSRPLLARKQQQVRVRSARSLPRVAADERRLAQVVLNLVTNASKYSGIGTRIDVTISTRSGKVRVTVADRGPGIPAGSAARIFEPYERGGRTDGDGVGIGLSVVRSILEAHGGTVGVKNRRAGGSVFWFELSALAGFPLTQGSDFMANERRVG